MRKLNLSLSLGLSLFFVIFSCTGQSEKVLSPENFQTKMSQPAVIILDVRTPEEFKAGHLKNAINIDIFGDQFESQVNKLDKEKTVLTYCLSGKRSQNAAEMLRTKGHKVQELKGGIQAWQKAGLPMVK
jgi:rhodanese-related sulfurtransferase